jgi:hypothetical protein
MYNQEAVVYVWSNHPVYKVLKTGHFGHCSILVQGLAVPNGAGYISWWPQNGAGKGNKKRALQGQAIDSFFNDCYSELSARARDGLEAGTLAARTHQRRMTNPVAYLPEHEEDDEDDFREWVAMPESTVHLPGLGATNAGVHFGLLTADMIAWYQRFQQANRYQLVSPTNSCAGAATGALLAGGADGFVDTLRGRLYLLPNDVRNWAISIRDAILWLNGRMAAILADATAANAAGRLGAAPNGASVHEGLWTCAAWEHASWVKIALRTGHVGRIDKALKQYHSLDWATQRVEQYVELAKIARGIANHLAESPNSDRKPAMLSLALQVNQVLQDLKQEIAASA